MFHVGDRILYGCSGACMIEELSLMRFGRTREEYYILRPLYQNAAKIYIPVSNPSLVEKMHPMPTREEVDAMILSIPDAEPIWVEDAQERKACYDRIMRTGESAERLRMIRTLHDHKQVRLAEGKNLHVSDENFYRDAQKLICDEFAFPLELQPSEVHEYIMSKLKSR